MDVDSCKIKFLFFIYILHERYCVYVQRIATQVKLASGQMQLAQLTIGILFLKFWKKKWERESESNLKSHGKDMRENKKL